MLLCLRFDFALAFVSAYGSDISIQSSFLTDKEVMSSFVVMLLSSSFHGKAASVMLSLLTAIHLCAGLILFGLANGKAGASLVNGFSIGKMHNTNMWVPSVFPGDRWWLQFALDKALLWWFWHVSNVSWTITVICPMSLENGVVNCDAHLLPHGVWAPAIAGGGRSHYVIRGRWWLSAWLISLAIMQSWFRWLASILIPTLLRWPPSPWLHGARLEFASFVADARPD